MALLDNLFGPVTDYQHALSRAAERHSLLTENLANLNTPGYKRKDIDFSITLSQEMDKQSAVKQAMLDQQNQRNSNSTSLRSDGNNVDLDREVSSLSETELRYQALTEMTQNYFSQLQSVIRGGG